MAFTVELLNSLKPEGLEDEKWQAVTEGVMKIHNDDVNGLVNNEKAFKAEKQKLAERLANLTQSTESAKATYEATIAELNKQISENSPESIRKAYETKLNEVTAKAEEAQKDWESKASGYEKQLAELSHGVFQRDCMDAFEKAIQGKNIDVDSIDAVRQLVMGDNFAKFARRDLGGGKTEITNNDTGKNIASSVADFLATPTGKHFVLNGSSGGGADGGNSNTGTDENTMSRAVFDALPFEEKAAAASKYKIV